MGIRVHTNDVCFSYARNKSRIPVLDHISFEVKSPSVLGIVGPSGCGKTTLLNVVAGLDPPESGRIAIEPKQRAIGFVFQEPSLVPWLSVQRNATFAAEIAGTMNGHVAERCGRLLDAFGLSKFAGNRPFELSGGMSQRVAVVRALLLQAPLLLLDEPFTGSDEASQQTLKEHVLEHVREMHAVAIVVTHDVDMVARMATRVVVLSPRPARIIGDIAIEPSTDRIDISSEIRKIIVNAS